MHINYANHQSSQKMVIRYVEMIQKRKKKVFFFIFLLWCEKRLLKTTNGNYEIDSLYEVWKKDQK